MPDPPSTIQRLRGSEISGVPGLALSGLGVV